MKTKFTLFFLLLIQTCFANYKYDLTICAIFRDEARYLKEWIEFHRLAGVQHFHLYNHHSIDGYEAVLEPYINEGIVDLHGVEKFAEWDQKYGIGAVQCVAYIDALDTLRGVSKWVAFIDTDEFLFCPQGQNLVSFLKGYKQYGGVVANWQLFGTSGVPSIPFNQCLIETLTLAAPKDYCVNAHIKTIVQPTKATWVASAHHMVYAEGFYQVNTDRLPFEGALSPYIQIDKLRINHYWSRDEDFFWNVKVARRLQWQQPIDNIILMYNEINQVKDKTILKYVPLLRQRLGMQ